MSEKNSQLQKLADISDKDVNGETDTGDMLENSGVDRETEDVIDSSAVENGALGIDNENTLHLRSLHSSPTTPTDKHSPSNLESLPPPNKAIQMSRDCIKFLTDNNWITDGQSEEIFGTILFFSPPSAYISSSIYPITVQTRWKRNRFCQ